MNVKGATVGAGNLLQEVVKPLLWRVLNAAERLELLNISKQLASFCKQRASGASGPTFAMGPTYYESNPCFISDPIPDFTMASVGVWARCIFSRDSNNWIKTFWVMFTVRRASAG